MIGGKHLLFLAVYVILARCQQKPEVSMSPELKTIFSGDLFYLTCKNTGGAAVTWFFNGKEETQITGETWKIAVASSKHSGPYHCVSNGQESERFPIKVLEYSPRASLIIKTGQPVTRPGGSVILQLDNDAGLPGWNCWVYRTTRKMTKRIKLKLNDDSVSLDFQRDLDDPETIFWCTDRTKDRRSNQIIVRTSDKDVSLEMYPLPAVTGEGLTLKCLTWGTDQISRAVFYKDNKTLHDGNSPTYKISNVAESLMGKYKCDATFTYKARTAGPPYHVSSDDQDLFVQEDPMKAALDGDLSMSCYCSLCPSNVSYYWYYMNDDDGQPSQFVGSSKGSMVPDKSGTYTCRAVWDIGMSYPSNRHVYNPPISVNMVVTVVIVLVLLGLVLAGVAFYLWNKRTTDTGPIYEDVGMSSRDKGDDKYEMLQRPHGAQKEGEYDTLNPEASGGVKKEGEYQPLKKEQMKEGVYHTLGMEGAAGGAGGYEALKKGGMKEGVYHTLGMEGAAGGEGGYEALKKEGMKEGEYHTLGMEGTAGGEGGYEALKKEGMKEGEYQTLGMEGTGGMQGGQ